MSNTYIVRLMRGVRGTPKMEHVYLRAIAHDPYEKGGDYCRRVTSPHQSDAFRFKERAAAELAAVMVGGSVVKLTKSVRLEP